MNKVNIYEEFVKRIANEYVELSRDKVFARYFSFIKEAQELIKNENKTTK